MRDGVILLTSNIIVTNQEMFMRTSMTSRILMALAIAVLAVITTRAQSSKPTPQERPDLYTTLQDSMLVYLVEGDTTDPNLMSGAFTFHMPYDSTCTTEYMFTEPWHNGRRLSLRNWIYTRKENVHENMLSFNSRTEVFLVKPGDTVSAYRELQWFNPITFQYDSTNFFSRDTLAFAIELVRASTMTRLALIDSICVLPQMPPGKPRIYGHLNTMAVARYAIPSWIGTDSVLMRIRLYARGSGEYYFTRTDHTTGDWSLGLKTPLRMADLELLRKCCWTQIPLPKPEESLRKEMRPGEGTLGHAILSVRQPEAGRADVSIELAPAPMLGELSVIIFDGQGNALTSPFSGTVNEARVIPHRFQTSGAYVICLVRSGEILETGKVVITN